MEIMISRKDLEELRNKAAEIGLILTVKRWVIDNHNFYCLKDIEKEGKKFGMKWFVDDENEKIPEFLEKYYRDVLYDEALKKCKEAFGNG